MKIFVNLITISRIIFSFMLMFKGNGISNINFLIIIAILFLTDQLDGYLARKFQVQTLFGAIMDTIADKILCLTLMLPLLKRYQLLLLMVIGEVLISLINLIANIQGKQTKSSLIGKIKMWILSLSIIVGYIVSFGYIPIIIINICSIITFIIQSIVIINYIITLKSQKTNKSNKIKTPSETIYNLFSTEYYLKKYI